MKYTAENLVVRPTPTESGVTNRVTQQTAGWASLNAETRRLRAGEEWSHQTEEHEMIVVLFGGRCEIHSSRGEWREVGARHDVFAGLPWALYLPRRTTFTVKATSALDFAC